MFFMPFGPGGCAWLCGFWGLFCFGLPGFWLLWLGVGLGLVWFSGLFVLTVALACLVLCCVGLVGVCWFCLESLILAQDERWRRA